MTDRNIFHIYIDESSQTGHGYMVVGALICRKDTAQDIADALQQCLTEHDQKPTKEFHWNELTKQTLQLYKDALSLLIGSTIKLRKMRYRALVVEMAQVDWSLNKRRHREMFLAKVIFTLVFGFARSFGPHIRFSVWIDKRADSLDDFEMDKRTLYSLNTEAKSKFGWAEGPFASVRFVDSKENRLIQAVDMITGAVAYETNEKHKAADASQHRLTLLKHAIECSTLTTFAEPSPRWPFGFQVRHFDISRSEAHSVQGYHRL